MRHVWLGLVAVLAIGWALPGWAQPKWAIGQTYSGNIDIGGVQIPLLPGEWTVTGFQSFVTKTNAAGKIPGNTITVALVQFDDRTVRAYAVFSYNELSVSTGWTTADWPQCKRQEIHYVSILHDKQTDRSCQYVNHIVYAVSSDSRQWWKDTIDFVVRRGGKMPVTTIAGGIVVSDRANYVSALVHFNPETRGFAPPTNLAWATSDWSKSNVAGDEKKKSFVQSVVDWTEKSRPIVEAGLAGKLKKGEGLYWPAAMQ